MGELPRGVLSSALFVAVRGSEVRREAGFSGEYFLYGEAIEHFRAG